MRYVIVTGGVLSGVGKGIVASSTGLLLKSLGLRVSSIKIDPYISFDAGLMNPAEHGECFVLGDGSEVDLDLGNYERYLSTRLTGDHNITTGKISGHVMAAERRGEYLGRTVQVVPHITDCIQEWIRRVAKLPVDESGEEPDICVVELGGTIGDMENAPFVEALSQMRYDPNDMTLSIHLSYIPMLHGQHKTKPTQHAVRTLSHDGWLPDLVACRCEEPLSESTVRKVALHCHVKTEQILVVHDMPSVYQVPLLLGQQKMMAVLRSQLKLDAITIPPEMVTKGTELWETWRTVVTRTYEATVDIVLVGKYVETQDAYMSVVKALEHSSMSLRRKLNLIWVDSEHLEPKVETIDQAKYHRAWHTVCTASGIIVPGGFGIRGTLGMMLVAKWARENAVPFLGVCLGFQIAIIQFARDFCGIPNATSEEFDAEAPKNAQTPHTGHKDHHAVVYMPELDRENMGGTMRLGSRVAKFQPGTEWSKLRNLYGNPDEIWERHRHRYEINPNLVERLETAGLFFVAKDEEGDRMEVFELKYHPFYVGTQFHAEYQSQVLNPSKPYLGFVAASAKCLDQVLQSQHRLNGSA